MANNEVFDAAKAAFTFHNAYLNTVGQVIGMDKAIELESRMCETMGAVQGKEILEQSDIKDFDAKMAYSVAKAVPESLGIFGELLEESPQKVRFKCRECSIYEGAKMAGLDDKTLENTCRKGSIRYMDNLVKQLNPNLSYKLTKFRSSADDSCEEEITLS